MSESRPIIAISGYRGFIGRQLLAAIEARGLEVLLVEGDVRSSESWDQRFDLLYHLAAVTPAAFAEDPANGFSVNVDGTLRAVDACRRWGAHFVFASTCGVRRPEADGTILESGELGPRTPYASSKAAAEILCHSYSEHFDVKTTILRLFNAYGPGQDSAFVIPYLVKQAVNGNPVRIKHPESVRDFVHVDDVVEAFLSVRQAAHPYSVYNVGSGFGTSIRGVIEILEGIIRRSVEKELVSDSRDPVPIAVSSIERISSALGWSPGMSLGQGLEALVRQARTRGCS